MGYRQGSHTVFEIPLHSVWVTKYRKPVLRGAVGMRVRALIRQVCRDEAGEVLKGPVSNDPVPLFASIPPPLTISRFVQRVKGKSSYKLLPEFRHLRRTYWGRYAWARGYFCCRSGTVTDAVIKEYIAPQCHEEDAEFKVEGEDTSVSKDCVFSLPVQGTYSRNRPLPVVNRSHRLPGGGVFTMRNSIR